MAAVTAQYALERGIEATFQLEDSELASEKLPDDGNRGRLLLIEAAEGGAGVLRRLATEPDALPRAAAEALRISHIDPDTGAEDADACVRGCYRCLLTYGNQTAHERIDRRAIIPAADGGRRRNHPPGGARHAQIAEPHARGGRTPAGLT